MKIVSKEENWGNCTIYLNKAAVFDSFLEYLSLLLSELFKI